MSTLNKQLIYYPFGMPMPGRSFVKQVCYDVVTPTPVTDLANEFTNSTEGYTGTNSTLDASTNELVVNKNSGNVTFGASRVFTITQSGTDHTLTFNLTQLATDGVNILCRIDTITVDTLSATGIDTIYLSVLDTGSHTLTFVTDGQVTGSNRLFAIDDVTISYKVPTPSTICGDADIAYRYGFNGQEKDDEIKGSGNSYDFGARILDPRLGRWLSIDALAASYPAHSPYSFALNTPIQAKDPDGNVVIFVNGYYGFPTQACCGGTKAHWGANWVNRVKNQIGDYNARYYDGSVDDRGFGGFAGRNNFDPNFRYKMGYMQGTTDAKDIVNNLEKGETIKIVTSSMGTAYARGLSQAITDYTTTLNKEIDAYNAGLEKNEDGSYKDPSQVREHIEAKIEYVMDLDSFQANQADPNAENNYYMKGDGVESDFLGTKDIQGSKKAGTMGGHHPSWANPSNFPESSGNGSGSSDIENPSKNQ